MQVPGDKIQPVMRAGARRTGGRSARVRAAVLDAAIEAVLAHGVDDLSIPEIARRAGVHETSVYRRWGTVANLALDALFSRMNVAIPAPDTGSLRTDLVTLIRQIAAFVATPLGELALRTGLRQDLDPDFEAARQKFWDERIRAVSDVLARAEARGELAPGLDHRLVWETVIGTLHARLLITRTPLTERFPEDAVDLLLNGIARG